jgi:hypothetical protein
MVDWHFACASKSAFVADLDAFTDGYGWPRLTGADGGLPSCRVFQNLRIDFDWIEDLEGQPAVLDAQRQVVTPAVMRGPHCNARATTVPGIPAAAAILAQLEADIADFFASQPLAAHDTPASMCGAYQVAPPQFRTTAGGTKLVTGIAAPKRRWA